MGLCVGERRNAGMKGKNKTGKGEIAINIVKSIFGFIGMGTIISILLFLYQGFLKQPQIKCIINGNEKIFSVKDDFRSISMILHPQIVVRFDNDIILLIYLEEYYKEEVLHFDENKECRAVEAHAEYVEELQKYMKEGIISSVRLGNSGISGEEINERLHIYINTLGGVQYESEQGNDGKWYCITEQDGIIKDYDEHDDEISDRLYETNLVMKDDLAGMETDEAIRNLIQGISEEIIRITKGK